MVHDSGQRRVTHKVVSEEDAYLPFIQNPNNQMTFTQSPIMTNLLVFYSE